MRKIISISLIVLVSIVTLHKSLVFAFYELDRDYVVETLCVNKDNPDSDCHGKCFLMKQTNENKAEGVLIQILKNIEIDFFIINKTDSKINLDHSIAYKMVDSICIPLKLVVKLIKPPPSYLISIG